MTGAAAIGSRIAALVTEAEDLAGELRQLAATGERRTHGLTMPGVARRRATLRAGGTARGEPQVGG